MNKTPSSLRLQIGIFGRTNVGKSSFLNMIAGQDRAITSPVPGTTTDAVEKAMELLPLGPVLLIDTAGLDDISELGNRRKEKTSRIFDRADVAVLVIEPGCWKMTEEMICSECEARKIPLIAVINKVDVTVPDQVFLDKVAGSAGRYITASAVDMSERERVINEFKHFLLELCPAQFLKPPPLIGDLARPGGLAVLVVPIDLEAPKGRLILPQVQAIRDALDNDFAALVVKEKEYSQVLGLLKEQPDIAVCDSQVVLKMVADTPSDVKCTTFSILFSRFRGDLPEAVCGVTVLDELKPGDRVLIAEACTHHPLEDDIGRVKIPRWIRQYLGFDVSYEHCAGSDYPGNLGDYSLIIHCGACMINRRDMLSRIEKAREAGVPVTNYGVCISYVQGVLERVLSPFPAALDAHRRCKLEKNKKS